MSDPLNADAQRVVTALRDGTETEADREFAARMLELKYEEAATARAMCAHLVNLADELLGHVGDLVGGDLPSIVKGRATLSRARLTLLDKQVGKVQ